MVGVGRNKVQARSAEPGAGRRLGSVYNNGAIQGMRAGADYSGCRVFNPLVAVSHLVPCLLGARSKPGNGPGATPALDCVRNL